MNRRRNFKNYQNSFQSKKFSVIDKVFLQIANTLPRKKVVRGK